MSEPRAVVCTAQVSPFSCVAGQQVLCHATFADATTGERVDVERPLLTVLRPDGGKARVTLTQTGPGAYLGTFLVPKHGMWAWQVAGAGGEGVAQGEIHVAPSLI